MTKKKTGQQPSSLHFDAMAEDLFGLNIRGIRSLTALWVHPRRYFTAAKAPDWNNRYTPSIRLWLSFFALFSIFKFWWIGGNEGMIGAYAIGFAQAGVQLPDGMTFEDIGKEAVLWVFGLVPFLQIASMMLLSLIYPFYGERTTLALRQRYLFAMIVPGASLMPVLMTIMVFVPAGALTGYALLMAAITFGSRFPNGIPRGFHQSQRPAKGLARRLAGGDRRITQHRHQHRCADCGYCRDQR